MSKDTLVAAAERIAGLRRRRGAFFDDDLFGEPAWDILLDLFIAQERGRRLSVSSVCLRTAAPPTAALRWIQTLITRGLLDRSDNKRDDGRSYLALTPHASEALERVLSEEAQTPPSSATPRLRRLL